MTSPASLPAREYLDHARFDGLEYSLLAVSPCTVSSGCRRIDVSGVSRRGKEDCNTVLRGKMIDILLPLSVGLACGRMDVPLPVLFDFTLIALAKCELRHSRKL